MIYHGNHHGKNFLSGRFIIHHFFEASLVAQLVKNPPAMRETWFDPWVGKIPWRRKRLPTPVFWPGESHGVSTKSWTRLSDWTELNWGQNTAVGSLFLLQGIFPTQGSNASLPYCRQILYQLSYQGRQPFKTLGYLHFYLRSLAPPFQCFSDGYHCFSIKYKLKISRHSIIK